MEKGARSEKPGRGLLARPQGQRGAIGLANSPESATLAARMVNSLANFLAVFLGHLLKAARLLAILAHPPPN